MPSQAPITVHVEQPEQQVATGRTGPAAIAMMAWLFVLVASMIVCGGIGFATYLAFAAPMPETAPLHPFRWMIVFCVAALILIPAYIAARAIDRLSQ